MAIGLVVKFELFEVYYWLELYELYYKKKQSSLRAEKIAYAEKLPG